MNQGIEHAAPWMIGLLLVAILLLIFRSRLAHVAIRKIAGVEAIRNAIESAAELGRPVAFSTGVTGVGPTLYACLSILRYVSKFVAQYRGKIFAPQNASENLTMVESAIRDGFAEAGRESAFDTASVPFLSEEQFAYASGYMGLVHRENVGAAFLFGSFAAEALILAEAGQQVGAIQIGGSVSPEQVPFFICTCDNTLIGEELFAAATYLNPDQEERGSLVVQDFVKLLIIMLIVFGVCVSTLTPVLESKPFPLSEYLMRSLGDEG